MPQPSQWLLERAHRHFTWLLPFACLGLVAYYGYYRPHGAWTLLVVYGVINLCLDLAGAVLHGLWDRGRIWQDTICPVCDDHHGGGGGGRFDFPDFPEEPDGQGRTLRDNASNDAQGERGAPPAALGSKASQQSTG
ncbi:hypothetical protein ABMX48_36815 [Streptomyces cavourensis]